MKKNKTGIIAALVVVALLSIGAVVDYLAPVVCWNMASLRNLTPNESKPAFVLGYYTPGDGGHGWYVVTNTITGTNAYGGRILAAGGAKSWQLATARDYNVLQFGALSYNWFLHPYYGISTTNVTSPGTGDFSAAISFDAMASYDIFANGLFRLSPPNNSNRSLEVYGIESTLQMLLRSTNGSSSVAGGAATISFASIPFTLGVSNNLVITRTAGTWLVYVNGTDVTGSATISGGSELSGSITTGLDYKPEVGLTSNFQMHRRPIYWLRYWPRKLSSAEVLTVQSLTDYTWQIASQLQTPPIDAADKINAAVQYAFENNAGIVRVPAGKYRLNSSIYMLPTITLQGDGTTDWVGVSQNNSNPSTLWAWDTSETNDVVVFDAQYMTNQYLYLPSRDGVYGAISNKVAQARVKNLGLSSQYSRWGRPVVGRNAANCSVEQCELAPLYGYLADVYAGNEFRIESSSSRGVPYRGLGIRYMAVADSRIFKMTMGGFYGPCILLLGANNNLIQENLNFNAQNNAVGTFAPLLDTSTDILTATNHNFFTGQNLFVRPGTGVLPTQLLTNSVYFAIRLSENTFKLANLYTANIAGTGGALQGNGIDFTNSGTAGWTLSAGPAVNLLSWQSDGNLITGNRMDQAYEQNVEVSGGSANSIVGNGLHMAGWANTVTTNIGAVKFGGETLLNQVNGNIFGITRVTSFARYGVELWGTKSNILGPNINFGITDVLNADGGTGKLMMPWQNLNGNVVLGVDPMQSIVAGGGHLMIPQFGSKSFSAPTGVYGLPWQSALVFNTNSSQNTLMVFHPGLGVWRSIPTYDRIDGNVGLANIWEHFTKDQSWNAEFISYSDNIANGGGLMRTRAGATDEFITYKAPVKSGMKLGTDLARGYYATNSLGSIVAEWGPSATEDFSVSAQGTRYDIWLTPVGSTTRLLSWSLVPTVVTDDSYAVLSFYDGTNVIQQRVKRGAAGTGPGGSGRMLYVP